MSMCERRGRHEGLAAASSGACPPPGELRVETQHHGDAVIVAIAGEFDLAGAEPVREALASAICEARQRVTIDLGRVTFIDSSGLHTILDAYTLCRAVALVLTIRSASVDVRRVFELTNLAHRLPFETAD